MDLNKAVNYYVGAWNKLKAGELFDEQTNTTFDYMLKSLWKTEHKPIIKADILKHFPRIFNEAKNSERPPPIFHILISLKDPDIIKEIQSLLLMDWIKSSASEESTFQVLNFISTFDEKGIPIDSFVRTIIKRINLSQHKDMIEALAHMITIQFPQYMELFLKRFLELSKTDSSLLKNYVQMNGRKAFLELMKIAPQTEMNKLYKEFARPA